MLDLPAILACIPVALLLDPFLIAAHVGRYYGSYFGAALWLIMGSATLRCFALALFSRDPALAPRSPK